MSEQRGNRPAVERTWDDELSNIKVSTLFWLSAKIFAVNIIWVIIIVVVFALLVGSAI